MKNNILKISGEIQPLDISDGHATISASLDPQRITKNIFKRSKK